MKTLKQNIEEHLIDSRGNLNPHCTRNPNWFKSKGLESLLHEILNFTRFIEDADLRERIFCIRNEIHEIPTCKRLGCENKVKFQRSTSKYAEHCSKECHLSDPKRINKIKETCLKKYGVENISKTEKFRKEQSEREKRNKGIKSEKCLKATFDRLKPHNDSIYETANLIPLFEGPTIRIDRMFQCKECSREFRFGDYPHLLSNGIRCPFCFPKRESKVELKVCKFLDTLKINYIRNDRKRFGFEVDILIKEFNLAIEIDGILWHSYGKSKYKSIDNISKEDPKKHLIKIEECEKEGFKLIRFTDQQIKSKFDVVKSIIRNELGLSKRIFARKTEAREISSKESRDFIENNHLHGYIESSKRFGLFYSGELVMVLTFGRPRFGKGFDFELYRLCTKKDHSVVGGFSKLMKFALENGVGGKIRSFIDRSFSDGNGFKKIGFSEISKTPPSYIYYHPTTGIILSRFKCQKHKLKGLLKEEFDSSKSETENMISNGYRKFYDCGNLLLEFSS